jgi:hypothetical protein
MGKLRRTLVLALAVALLAAAPAPATMQSTKLGPRLCETTGGGRFVRIPGFPGERIDRRLLTDIRWLKQRYRIFVTDGYSLDPVHAENGEHPLGLALDIVPDRDAGGSWNTIDRLAAWAEPRRNRPRQPFRWVGYDGDAGHGRGDHLHLSWGHSDSRKGPGHPVRTVYTIRCPAPAPTPPPVEPTPEPPQPPPDGQNGDGDGGNTGGAGTGGGGPGSGGIGSSPRLAPPVIELDGIGRADR